MKGQFKRSYRSQKGDTVFVYTVTGTASEIADYQEIMGDQLRTDDETGEPLMFTTRYFGNSGDLIVVGNDEKGKRVIPDMSQYEAAASLSKQFGGDLGQELAKAAAERLLGAKSTPVSAPKVTNPDGSNASIGGM